MTETETEAGTFKVISFNLRHDAPLSRHNRWQERKALAAQLIKESGAVIIGVQELMPHMREDVEELLAGEYNVIGFGRYYGVRRRGQDEHSDILIKTDAATLRYCKTFWLSKTPERYGSKAYFSFFPRICTVAEVTLAQSGQRIRVFNTHFDHICGPARNLGVRIILDYMARYNDQDPLPSILMGDLNAGFHSRPIRILRENLHNYEQIRLQDVYKSFDPSSITNTFHHFSGKAKAGKSPIDYIFVSEDFEVVESHIYTEGFDGRYPSDHYPLVATLRLRTGEKKAED